MYLRTFGYIMSMHVYTSAQQYAYVSTGAPIHVQMCTVLVLTYACMVRVQGCLRACAHAHVQVCVRPCVCMKACDAMCVHTRARVCMVTPLQHAVCAHVGVHIKACHRACAHVCMFGCRHIHLHVCVGMHLCECASEHARALALSNEEHLFLAVSP